MSVLVVILAIGLGLSGSFWSRFRLPMHRGSRLDDILGQINLVSITIQGFVIPALTFTNGRAGIPVLGFAAGGLLLASVPLYFIKKKNPLLAGVQWQGRHVDEESNLRLTSRWPRSAACTAGYVCLSAYFLSWGLCPDSLTLEYSPEQSQACGAGLEYSNDTGRMAEALRMAADCRGACIPGGLLDPSHREHGLARS